MRKIFILEDLDCAHCAGKIEDAVNKIEGVNKAKLTFMTKKLVIDGEEFELPRIEEEMKKIVKKFEPDVTVHEK